MNVLGLQHRKGLAKASQVKKVGEQSRVTKRTEVITTSHGIGNMLT